MSGTTYVSRQQFNGAGNHQARLFFQASGLSATIKLELASFGAWNTGSSYFDNISVREINPLSVSFGYKALVTYADTNTFPEAAFYTWSFSQLEKILGTLTTTSSRTGSGEFIQRANGPDRVSRGDSLQYSPGINVPMSIASRHGSTVINCAIDGTALTANTTPVAFPALTGTDLIIASIGGPQVIQEFIMWGGTTGDIGDAGIAETSA
jgi:hypothetical protein